MKNSFFSFLFAVVFVVQVCAEAIHANRLIYLSKPCIVLVLACWLCWRTQLKGRFHKRILTGLSFAFAGDLFLMLQDAHNSFFIYGLLSFLLCHIFYIRAFILDHKSNPDFKSPFFLWAAAALIIFCIGLFFYLQPFLGSMQFAVLMYAIVLTIMAIMAVNRYGKVNLSSFQLVMYGALFFLLSDSVLAINKFVQPVPQSGVLIMAGYMIAQYLITYGSVERKLVVTRTEI